MLRMGGVGEKRPLDPSAYSFTQQARAVLKHVHDENTEERRGTLKNHSFLSFILAMPTPWPFPLT